ncbi:MAG: hypothetical protein K8S55_02355 [Phycisphaerae bacterium]|nr:hypothetical protein [Phycisphaerae bacterium]
MKNATLIAMFISLLLWGIAGEQSAATAKPTGGENVPVAKSKSKIPPAVQNNGDIPAGAEITDDGWFAPPPKTEKPSLPKKITKAFVIKIREPIKGKTFRALRRKATYCRRNEAELIIIDMDTWGGEVGAALDMTRFLKTEMDDVYVLCYVRTRGISAGAMIAVSCDEIIMAPSGKLGDCAPIIMGGKLTGVEREKIETVLRTEFEDSADRSGYNVPLATSMVSHDQEVWLVRNRKTRELRYVLAADYRSKVTNPPGEVIKLADKVTLSTKQSPAATKSRMWELVKVVLAKGKLLTMTSRKAKLYGFATDLVKAPRETPYAGLEKRFNITAAPVVLEDSWSEDLVDFMTHPVVTGILVFLMLLFGYTEMHTPGFGVFGGIAIACLITLLCSQFLVGMANWWEIAMLVVGLVLIALEIFVIPGFGVAGITGITLCLIAGLAIMVPNGPDKLPIPESAWAWEMFKSGLLTLSLAFIASVIGMVILSRFLPKMPLFSRMILKPAESADDAPRAEDSPMLAVQPGDIGVTESSLHPVGLVRFGDELLGAVSDGGMIDANKSVRVVRRDGNRIMVEEA